MFSVCVSVCVGLWDVWMCVCAFVCVCVDGHTDMQCTILRANMCLSLSEFAWCVILWMYMRACVCVCVICLHLCWSMRVCGRSH